MGEAETGHRIWEVVMTHTAHQESRLDLIKPLLLAAKPLPLYPKLSLKLIPYLPLGQSKGSVQVSLQSLWSSHHQVRCLPPLVRLRRSQTCAVETETQLTNLWLSHQLSFA